MPGRRITSVGLVAYCTLAGFAYAGVTWFVNQYDGHNQRIANNDSAFVWSRADHEILQAEKWQKKKQADTNATLRLRLDKLESKHKH